MPNHPTALFSRSQASKTCSFRTIALGAVMLLTPTAAAAGDKVVLAVDGPESTWKASVSALEDAGFTVVDGSDVHRLTVGQLIFNVNSDPPNGWPRAIRPLWLEGTATCRERAGGPPYTVQNSEVLLCSRELAPALWQAYIDHHRPDRVVVIDVRRVSKLGAPPIYDVHGEGYRPEATMKKTSAARRVDDQIRFSTRLAVRAAKGIGAAERRIVADEMPERAHPNSAAMRAGKPLLDLNPVAPPKVCKHALPTEVVFEPAVAPFAQTVASLWERSLAQHGLKKAAPPLRCQLLVYKGTKAGAGSLLMQSSLMSVRSTVSCEGYPPVHGAALGISVEHAQKKLATSTTKRLLKTLCSEPGPGYAL